MSKKIIILAIALLFVLGGTLTILAETRNTDTDDQVQSMKKMEDHDDDDDDDDNDKIRKGFGNGSSFLINRSNKIIVNGASLVSNSGQSLSVKVFGLNLSLVTNDSTVVIGAYPKTATSISDMKVGDIIDFKGKIDANSGVVTVEQIRDENMQQQNIEGIKKQIQALLDQLKKLREQLHM